MAADPDITAVAAAIGQHARATMLSVLLRGTPLTVTELAREAKLSASTASLHLAKLSRARLVVAEAAGRERHYRLSGPEVAGAIEALQRLAPCAPVRSLSGSARADQLRLARTCYDHLAGWLGVEVTEALVARDRLRPNGAELALTPAGQDWLSSMGIQVAVLRGRRRGFALACQDWSQRRPHLAGAVGAALLERYLELGWVERRPGTRALRVSSSGERAFQRELGVLLASGRAATARN